MVWTIAAFNAVLTLVGWMLKDWFVILGNGFLTVLFTVAAYQIDRRASIRSGGMPKQRLREIPQPGAKYPGYGPAGIFGCQEAADMFDIDGLGDPPKPPAK